MKLSVLLPGRGFPKLRSAVTLLESEGRRVLVDTGLSDDGDKLVAVLAGHGLAPEDIDTIVSTHLHHDHCGNHLLFTKARFIVGAADYVATQGFIAYYHADTTPEKTATADLMRSKNASIKEYYVRSIVREVSRNLAFYNAVLAGDERFQPVEITEPLFLTSEIEIIATPGHTPGHLSVVAHGVEIEGERVSVLVGGDAIYSRNGEAGGNGDAQLAWKPSTYRSTRDALLARYRWVVPGHDTLMPMGARAPAGDPS
jgi:glyoxylase-like metal-dependent hydrolase (beta-lactamase superfamily II)